MKNLKAIGAALVLALSLSVPVLADSNPGDGHTPGQATTEPIGLITSTDPAKQEDGDIVLLGYTDILWALAAIF